MQKYRKENIMSTTKFNKLLEETFTNGIVSIIDKAMRENTISLVNNNSEDCVSIKNDKLFKNYLK
jgi:hypothetical protein